MLRAFRLVVVAGMALVVCGAGGYALGEQPDAHEKGAGVQATSTMPVSRLTLYRSGVASVERRGSVVGNQKVELAFRSEQINDILKSLVVLDLSGGTVGEVTYTSQEPLERRLRGLGINLADNPPMGEVLQRLRGVRVRLRTLEGEPVGTVVNVERRTTVVRGTPGGNHAHLELPWISLLTEQGVRSYNLAEASGFEILDAKLAGDFSLALAAIAQQRGEDVKSVGLRFRGEGTREVMAAYVQQAPVWKTSYRLVLPEDGAGGEGGKGGARPMLQGWAIVENTSDEDWKDVGLALASGQPSAFQMNLYEPVFTERPWVQVPVPRTLVARAYERGMLREPASADARMAEDSTMGSAPRSEAVRASAPAPSARGKASNMVGAGGQALSMIDAAGASVVAAAAGMTTGQAFFYELAEPVSIGRQQSAMLPIVSQEVSGRRVSIYNASQHATSPMRGVEVRNDTGLQLIAGPVSVFDGGMYAGDAQLNDVSREETRLLAYALDQDVGVRREAEVSSEVQAIAIKDRALRVRRLSRHTTTLLIENLDKERGRTIIIEEPAMAGWELAEPAKAKEQTLDTSGLMRFEVEVARGGKATQKVVQEQTTTEAIWVMHVDAESLAMYASTGKLSPGVRAAVERAQELQGAINVASAEVQRLEGERAAIGTDQDRIRQNMQTVDRTSDLYQRLMTKLGQQETRIEELARETAAARGRAEAAQRALDAYLGSLNLE